MSESYQLRKSRERERQASQARAGNDISIDFPKIPAARRKKRNRYADSLLAFCREVLAEKFQLEFSPDHLKAIQKMERAILEGGNFALAMPRGSGKTTLILAACLWAMLHGHKRYLALIGADKSASQKLMRAIVVELECNESLLELYPEACYPFRRLERIANRCKGQNWLGNPTYIEYTADRVVFASIPNSKLSGAIVEVQGITGRIRGMQHVTPDGKTVRPDIFVVDDPQTDKSAKSRTMVEQRLEVITGTCPGLAGPNTEISGFCLCTVIEEDDVADQLLDPEKYPEWSGERFQLVYSWPTGKNEELWEEYANILRESLAASEGYEKATAFYEKHRAAMDRDFVVGWPQRFTKSEISAQQYAFNLLTKLGDGFWKEYQNEPGGGDGDDEDLLSVNEIQLKTNGFGRGIVPPEANLLTAFVDVQGQALYWLVLAVRREDFSAWVVDYGTFPEQKARYFTLAKITRTLSRLYPKAGKEGRIRSGILELVDKLLERKWTMPDGTTNLKIKRIGLDAAWESRVVQSAALESKHAATLLPRFGRGVDAGDVPFESWRGKPGETRGIGWKIRPAEGGGVYAIIDTNYWKNFVHARLGVATGDVGSLSFFKPKSRTEHQMLAEHCRAEKRIESKNGERRLLIYKDKPSKPDNHLWDCLTGSYAIAGVEGAQLGELKVSQRAALSKVRSKPRRKSRRVVA